MPSKGSNSPRVVVSVRRADGYAEDRGNGQRPRHSKSGKHEEIFKPFVSTKGGKGTGLGLPVSRKTLREHGGDVVVNERRRGTGTEFVLRLPMQHDAPSTKSPRTCRNDISAAPLNGSPLAVV